jgi:ankyrin repeat protein
MDKKEQTIYESINSLTSQSHFIEAVKNGDIDECRHILANKPKAIRSVDRKDRHQSAPHIAVEKGNFEMLKFLSTQSYFDVNIEDNLQETALFGAIKT